MFHRVLGHTSINSVAVSIPGVYRELVLRLCELHAVPIARFEGTAFVKDEDVERLRGLVAEWKARPVLKVRLARRSRAKRLYRFWHPKHRRHHLYWEKVNDREDLDRQGASEETSPEVHTADGG